MLRRNPLGSSNISILTEFPIWQGSHCLHIWIGTRRKFQYYWSFHLTEVSLYIYTLYYTVSKYFFLLLLIKYNIKWFKRLIKTIYELICMQYYKKNNLKKLLYRLVIYKLINIVIIIIRKGFENLKLINLNLPKKNKTYIKSVLTTKFSK